MRKQAVIHRNLKVDFCEFLLVFLADFIIYKFSLLECLKGIHMNKYIKYAYITLTGFIFALLFSLPALATEKQNNQESLGGFSYAVNFPENQMDHEIGYFRLKMKPAASQTISISITNPSSVPVKVNVALNGAKTNNNGVIEYGDNEFPNDDSLTFDFVKLVSAPKSIELSPKETKELKMDINMPEKTYDGIIVGGVQLMKADSEEDKEKNKGTTVINRYAYIIPIILQESDQSLSPDLKLNRVYPDQANGRNAIFINFSNVIATYLNNMSVEVEISKKGSSEVLYESKTTSMRMAPNTMIDYPVSLNGERMQGGDYSARILVKSDDNSWEWTEDFKISQQTADKFNEKDVELVQDESVDWKIVGVIVAILMAIIGVTMAVIRDQRKKKIAELKKRRKKKRA